MSSKKVANYVRNRNNSLPEHNFGSIHVLVKDPITNNIDLASVFKKINYLIPQRFLDLLDIVYVGQFDIFKEKSANAMYTDGALYITNEQDDDEDLIDDVVHEIGHAVEKEYNEFVYGDGKIEDEFILKRAKIKRILQNQGYDVESYNFLNTEYDEDLDFFLLDDVGYDALSMFGVDLFLNPYSITSLQEYFATGFEEFYLENSISLQQLCPYIYRKLIVLHEEAQDW
jgi:ribosome-binding ATPase YchF (GTP1/OBG family)